jgi:hypothetical protein
LLVSEGGGPGIKSAALGMPNGFTFCQLKKAPPAGGQLGVFCHSPGTAAPGSLLVSGADPSPTRRAIIAVAAATPVAMPSVLAALSVIAASELARAASRVAALAGK